MSKFKTKEELIKWNPYMTIEVEMTRIEKVYNRGVTNAFESFKERIDFFKKYRWIGEEQFKKEYAVIYQECYLYEKNAFLRWDDWLFSYCFGDVQ